MNSKLITKGSLVIRNYKINFDADTNTSSIESESGDTIQMYSKEDVEGVRDLLWELRDWYQSREVKEVA